MCFTILWPAWPACAPVMSRFALVNKTVIETALGLHRRCAKYAPCIHCGFASGGFLYGRY